MFQRSNQGFPRSQLPPDRFSGEKGKGSKENLKAVPQGRLHAPEWVDLQFGYSFPSETFVEQLFTPRKINHAKNYERFEFIGDAVLCLALTRILFDVNPERKTAELAKRRTHLSKNMMLRTIASEKGIRFPIQEINSRAGAKIPESVSQDVIEAIIGGIFRVGGYEVAEGCVAKFFGEKALRLGDNDASLLHYKEYIAARERGETYKNGNWTVNRSWQKVDDDSLRRLCESISSNIGCFLRDTDLCFWAATPYLNASLGLSSKYRRLTRLGRLALSLAVTDELMTREPFEQEGPLTERRQMILSDTSLASSARLVNLDSFFNGVARDVVEEHFPDQIADSFLANHFKAFTGGIFIDSGFDAVKKLCRTVQLISWQ